MQDGATPHTALSTREYLRQTFHGRVIGKHFDKPWPPYSPDLTPVDFYLWPPLKSDMYSGPNPYISVAQLKRTITFTFKKFDFIPEQVVKRGRLCVHHIGDRWVKTLMGNHINNYTAVYFH